MSPALPPFPQDGPPPQDGPYPQDTPPAGQPEVRANPREPPAPTAAARTAVADGPLSTRLRPRISRLWWFSGPMLAMLLVAISVLAAMPLPYLAVRPGSARAVEPLITLSKIDGGPPVHAEKPGDDLLFVTVSVRRPAGIEALWYLTDETVEIVPEKVITGNQSREENTRFNLQLMTASKDKAAKVALERAGYEVSVSPNGAVVTDLDPIYPVAEVVHPGDTIVGADGAPVMSTDDLVAAIAAHEPGEDISLTLEPIGDTKKRTVSVPLVARPDDASKAMLGVSLGNRPKFTFPIHVEIDSGRVGGPSAGLAFTLAILDRLTEGDLTGDGRVAVTGTIELDGTVGPVGGVVQKTEAAVRAGARVFLVPPDEYADARRSARGRIEIHQVSTVDEALDALDEIGGDPIPEAPVSEGSAGG